MPAYRSSDEADIRMPAVARLRELIPGARIIHEIQCACQGPNRIDVLAVSPTRIAAVEVKSRRDKLDRLPDQIKAMQGCAHHIVAALHRKFFTVTETPRAGAWIAPPEEAAGAQVWGFDLPTAKGVEQYLTHDLSNRWQKPMACPPPGAIHMLWREELRAIADRRTLHRATSRMTRIELIDAMCWQLTGADITREICATLRARDCPEADPPMPWTGGMPEETGSAPGCGP